MIERAPRSADPFTRVHNSTIEDGRLSFKALGVLVYVLSKPDHWRVNRKHLASTHTDGEDAVRSALAELTAAGFITTRREGGGADGPPVPVLVVHEVPQVVGNPPRGEIPQEAEPPGGKAPAVVTTEENQLLSEATSLSSSPQLPLVALPSPPAVSGKTLAALFGRFWAAYPLKVGKQAAQRNFEAAVRKGVDPEAIIEGARRYAADPNRRRTKHAQGWLTDGRWMDEALEAWDDGSPAANGNAGAGGTDFLTRLAMSGDSSQGGGAHRTLNRGEPQ